MDASLAIGLLFLAPECDQQLLINKVAAVNVYRSVTKATKIFLGRRA